MERFAVEWSYCRFVGDNRIVNVTYRHRHGNVQIILFPLYG